MRDWELLWLHDFRLLWSFTKGHNRRRLLCRLWRRVAFRTAPIAYQFFRIPAAPLADTQTNRATQRWPLASSGRPYHGINQSWLVQSTRCKIDDPVLPCLAKAKSRYRPISERVRQNIKSVGSKDSKKIIGGWRYLICVFNDVRIPCMSFMSYDGRRFVGASQKSSSNTIFFRLGYFHPFLGTLV